MNRKILSSLTFQISLSLCIILSVLLAIFLQPRPGNLSRNNHFPAPEIREIATGLPMRFEINEGQAGPEADFICRGNSHTVLINSTGMMLSLPDSKASDQSTAEAPENQTQKTANVLNMKLLGANASAEPSGVDKLVTRSNYFIGNDPEKWRTDIPNFGKVKYEQVYEGIDLLYYGNQGRMEYDFLLSPGSEPDKISLMLEGAETISINKQGDLVLKSGRSELAMLEPVAYQERGGKRERIPAAYDLQGENRVGFSLGDYDPELPLVIDPVIAYSTYLGGSGPEDGKAIAVDTLGNVYVTGMAQFGFPVDDNPLQRNNAGGYDVFVAKLKGDGSELLYATYIGGSTLGSGLGGDDIGYGIAVDPEGYAYITGMTQSDDFPLEKALQTTYRGDDFYADAFVVKLKPEGNALQYSTYLGGDENDIGYDIVADKSGHAYVVGETDSENFHLEKAYDASQNGLEDVFVSKIKPDGSDFVFSTYLGGRYGDHARGIDIDQDGSIYLTGGTYSDDFPMEAPYQSTWIGGDAFVTKMKADGSDLVFSTYLTGTGDDPNDLHIDVGTSIAVDSLGFVFVAGMTQSPDFPTVNAVQKDRGSPPDGFVTKFKPDGSEPVYSTYLGGDHWDGGLDIEVDPTGVAYVSGGTQSSDFKTENPIQSSLNGIVDVFVTIINADGTDVVFSTYLGGSGFEGSADWDGKHGVAVDLNRNVYVTSVTSSADFFTKDSLQGIYGGGGDAFITKIDIELKINWIEITSQYTLPDGIRLFEGSRTDPELKVFYIDADLNRPELSVRPYLRGTKTNVRNFNNLEGAYASVNGGFFYKNDVLSSVVYPSAVKARNVEKVNREVSNVERSYPVVRGFFSMKKDRTFSVDWIYHFGSYHAETFVFPNPLSYSRYDPSPKPAPNYMDGSSYFDLLTGIGGGPVLIKDNTIRVTYDEEILWGSGVGYNNRDPRSAVGYTADKHVIMLVADGRSDKSEGVGLPELASIMKDLGCVEALNLDGGGSSQLVVGNTFVNKPSDPSPRAVPAILSIVHTNALNLHDTPSAEFFLETDADDTEVVGSWTETTDTGSYGSSNALVIPSGEGLNYITYQLELSQEDEYEVYAWWVAADDRSKDAPYIIYHKNGIDTVRVNQTINGSFWNIIGNYTFTGTSSDKIKITDGGTTGGTICADAIRVVSYDESTGIHPPAFRSDQAIRLQQNYPNPFSRETEIRYHLPSLCDVHVTVYNMKGQKIKTLLAEKQSAGWHSVTWDGMNVNGSQESSGTYIVRVEAGGHRAVKQMMLLR